MSTAPLASGAQAVAQPLSGDGPAALSAPLRQTRATATPHATPHASPEALPAAPFPEAFFLPVRSATSGAAGQRLCLYHAPATPGQVPRGRVLYLHPFAEELNTARRTVAQQARALARAGFAVLQIDLPGCGDSSGRLEDARWSDWLHDAQAALAWLDRRLDNGLQAQPHTTHPARAPLWLWGLRAGALLAGALADALSRGPSGPPHLLFWQPCSSGQQALQQFLRLHAAGQWLQAGAPVSTAAPAQALARGEAVDIAGYRLSPALAADLREARLCPPALQHHASAPPRLVWLDCAPQPGSQPGPAAQQALQAWRTADWRVQAQSVPGPAFWQTVGWDEAPALLQATTAALCDPAPLESATC